MPDIISKKNLAPIFGFLRRVPAEDAMNNLIRSLFPFALASLSLAAAEPQIVYWLDSGSKPCPALGDKAERVEFIIRGGTGVAADYTFHIERVRRLDNIPVISLNAQSGAPEEPKFAAMMDDSADWRISISQFGAANSEGGARPLVRKREWTCGEDTTLILSAGALFTRLQNRTYRSVRVPSAGEAASNVLAVQGGNSSFTPLGTALFNFKIPTRVFPYWSGLSISTGPVFRFGGSPEVSSFGYFAGVSANVWHGLYITPGFQLGEFADYPAGFTNGQAIPANFGTLEPTKRWSWRFAFAITYRVKSFDSKKPAAAATAPAAAAATSTGGTQGGSGGSAGNPPVSPAKPVTPAPQE